MPTINVYETLKDYVHDVESLTLKNYTLTESAIDTYHLRATDGTVILLPRSVVMEILQEEEEETFVVK